MRCTYFSGEITLQWEEQDYAGCPDFSEPTYTGYFHMLLCRDCGGSPAVPSGGLWCWSGCQPAGICLPCLQVVSEP